MYIYILYIYYHILHVFHFYFLWLLFHVDCVFVKTKKFEFKTKIRCMSVFLLGVREYFTYLDVNIVARWVDGGKYFARHLYCLWVKVWKYWYRSVLGIYTTFNQGGFFMYAYCDRGPRFFGTHPKNRFM